MIDRFNQDSLDNGEYKVKVSYDNYYLRLTNPQEGSFV